MLDIEKSSAWNVVMVMVSVCSGGRESCGTVMTGNVESGPRSALDSVLKNVIFMPELTGNNKWCVYCTYFKPLD